METFQLQKNHTSVSEFLLEILSIKASPEMIEWLSIALAEIKNGANENKFFQLLGKTPSHFPKDIIRWEENELRKAQVINQGLDPKGWTLEQIARMTLLLAKYNYDNTSFENILRKYHQTADLGEQIFIYLTLPLLPDSDKYTDLASLGIRSNMKSIFESIALNSPYPAKCFSLPAWNQMILKAQFVGSPLYKIYGLDERNNAQLAAMLADFAHERWSAGRSVSPELWRPIGPFINDAIFKDILYIFFRGNEVDKEAAALACYTSGYTQARDFLDIQNSYLQRIISGEISWKNIGEKWEHNKN